MEEKRWNVWSKKVAGPESMVLSDDPRLYSDDREELLDYLPPFTGASVLELGCGIGRFTESLGLQAHDVTAVDLIPKFMDVCRDNHGHLTNITFICQDILKLELSKDLFDLVFSGQMYANLSHNEYWSYRRICFDVVFSRWMYANLSPSECLTVTHLVLEWLRPGGKLVFRECGPGAHCSKHTGHHRSPLVYEQLVQGVQVDCYNLMVSHFKNSRAYITLKDDVSQVYYVAQKVPTSSLPRIQEPLITSANLPFPTLQEQDFQTAVVVQGQQVLVLGCGFGGLVFYLARTFKVSVLGVDPSTVNINKAIHYQDHLDRSVARLIQFEKRATEDAEHKSASFDIILLGVCNMKTSVCCPLVSRLRRWVQPRGGAYIIDENTFMEHEISIEAKEFFVVGFTDEDHQ